MTTPIPIEQMEAAPATEVKNRWKNMMRTVTEQGHIVVTNHGVPDAVILSVKEYEHLAMLVAPHADSHERTLESLRKRFDVMLASLNAPDASERLRNVMRKPFKLGGKVKAGQF